MTKNKNVIEVEGKIVECLRSELPMSALCRKYEISRKTGYKWWRRFEREGRAQLVDRSHAARSHPNATAEEIVTMLVSARKAHPTWGPRKLVRWLSVRHPRLRLPSPSTVGMILKRQGMSRPRRTRPRATPYAAPFLGCDAPNVVWCADFKGSFVMGNGRRCNALTISDAYSRYLLRCEAMSHIDDPRVRPVFESAFAEFGLPAAIRTDNGPPFSTVAPAGLSRLAIWWIKLGIRAERIAPGAPQQNGRHERMHLTLKREATKPAAPNFLQQQARFDAFVARYNDERPHEALAMRVPADDYLHSPRPYGGLGELEYPFHDWTAIVTTCGRICYEKRKVNLSTVFAGQKVGVAQVSEHIWLVTFMDYDLGYFDDETCRLEPIENPFQPKVLPMSPE